MAIQDINIGLLPNDGTGDKVRDAFDKVNQNFDELSTGLDTLITNQAIVDSNQDLAIQAVQDNLDTNITNQAIVDSNQDLAIQAVQDNLDTVVLNQSTRDIDQDLAIQTVQDNLDTAIAGIVLDSDGITNVSTVTGLNVSEALETLQTTINLLATPPTYVAPTSSITNVTNSYEMGSSVAINITQTFVQNNGGAKISENIFRDSVSVSTTPSFAESLTVVPSTVYSGNVTFAEGPILNNSIGLPDPNGHILPGTSVSANRTVSGIYPVYYMKSSTPLTAASLQTAINNGTATKLVISSTGSFSVPYAPNAEYMAVGYPATSTTKTKWYVTLLSNGAIPGGVFGAHTTLPTNSFQGYWSNVDYKIHVTPLLTNPGAPTIQLQN